MTQPATGRPSARPGFKQALRSFNYANYRWYWVSGIGMAGAQSITQFAVIWLVLDLTGSSGQVGLVALAQGTPMIVVTLFGGVLADLYDRRTLIIASQLASIAGLLVLAALTLAAVVELWHVYSVSFLLGVTQALMAPARQAMIAGLVPREQLTNAVALNSMQQLASRMLWPSLAGLTVATLGIGATFVVNAGCFVAAVAALLVVRGVPREPPRQRRAPVTEVIEGINYARSTPVISLVVGLTLAFGLFGLAFVQLGPAFARAGLGFGAGEAGLFMFFIGLGALAGSAGMSVFNLQSTATHFLAGTMVFAVTLVLFAINPWTPLVFAIAFVNGAFNSIQVIASNAIFQQLVPSQFLGRVVSLWFLAAGVAALSALPIGVLGDLVNLRFAFACAGAVYILLALWFGILRTRLRGWLSQSVDS